MKGRSKERPFFLPCKIGGSPEPQFFTTESTELTETSTEKRFIFMNLFSVPVSVSSVFSSELCSRVVKNGAAGVFRPDCLNDYSETSDWVVCMS